jgi:hypothetical protein
MRVITMVRSFWVMSIVGGPFGRLVIGTVVTRGSEPYGSEPYVAEP